MGLQLSATLGWQHCPWQPAWQKEELPHNHGYFQSDTCRPYDFSTQGHLISCSFTTILAQMQSRFHFNRSKMETAQHPGDYCWNKTQKCREGKALKHHHWEAEGTGTELQRHLAARSRYTYTLNIHVCYISVHIHTHSIIYTHR